MQATRLLSSRLNARLVPGPNGCVVWDGATVNGGYGVTTNAEGRQLLTHRVAWELAHGPIPSGLFVCHRCDNPPCCNVEHLFLGTPADNVRDMWAKGRGRGPKGPDHHNSVKSHCPQGHVYDETNTYITPRGFRQCRTCSREAGRRYRARVTPRQPE